MRREKSLRIGVHHADAVVWGPVYRTHPRGERRVSSSARVRRAEDDAPPPTTPTGETPMAGSNAPRKSVSSASAGKTATVTTSNGRNGVRTCALLRLDASAKS